MYMQRPGERSGVRYSTTMQRYVDDARKHYRSKNVRAEHVFPHCEAALYEGIRGGIIIP